MSAALRCDFCGEFAEEAGVSEWVRLFEGYSPGVDLCDWLCVRRWLEHKLGPVDQWGVRDR